MQALLVAAVSLVLVVGVSAGGRAKKITVDIHSLPEGARVLLGDARTFAGYTPLPVTYQVDGCQPAQGAEVQWASGATATAPRLSICAATGKHQQITFERPADLPGLELDTQVAFQQALLAQMRADTAAIVDAQTYATVMAQMTSAWQPLQFRPASVSCIAHTVAGQTFVRCR